MVLEAFVGWVDDAVGDVEVAVGCSVVGARGLQPKPSKASAIAGTAKAAKRDCFISKQ